MLCSKVASWKEFWVASKMRTISLHSNAGVPVEVALLEEMAPVIGPSVVPDVEVVAAPV